mmetsp:Transcript_29027/g.81783  ORF Transcript_29027/g.81783 Transcript_29027/m.81783 type:complete len:156 (-) Transcript_29027:96-563(-)|eukprot:CAMPEP_0117657352 /NCGR_PEP_ID=MMETSP0804-20121206/5284_1 /TAXON_ID=1074897 /ORGANISM="Tetraselmis astigmatica, Strain CCMP880" /LENGTH=155 /DNA_ID=CAMNT_0005463799 /DNA_START=171 /DNA_END=638 /DNA_ORIENTATION=-
MDDAPEPRRLLAAVDTRYRSGVEAVCSFTCNEVFKEGDVVDFVCVVDAPVDGNADEALVAKVREDILSMCTESIGNRLVHEVPFDVHAVVGPGNSSNVVDDIVDISRKLDASMVVVGTHSRHPLQQIFLGSVATRLLSKCPVPVVIVRSHGYQAA